MSSAGYLVEQQNEVDGKAHKQSQETEVVEVTSQVILQTKTKLKPDCFMYYILYQKEHSLESYQHLGCINVQNGKDIGHEGRRWLFGLT